MDRGTGPACPEPGAGLFHEPVSAVSSLAFVAAGLAIALRSDGDADRPRRLTFAALVTSIGIGSVIQHGPDPTWSDLAHDLPLLGTLAFVAADSAAALAGRRPRWWHWAGPTVALVPVILAAPRAGDLAQVGVAAVAVGLTLARAARTPLIRTRVGWAVVLLGSGGLLGVLSRAGGPLCVPGSLGQGHAAWHVLASAALVVLAPVVTARVTATASPAPRSA